MGDWYRKRAIGDLPREAARRWPDREAMHFQGRRWSHRQVADEIDALAKSLIALGVKNQEKVALWLINRPELFFLFFAVLKVGAVVVPLNTRYRTEDLAVALRKADCAHLVGMDRSGPIDFAGMLRAAVAGGNARQTLALPAAGFPWLRSIVLLGETTRCGPGVTDWQIFTRMGSAVTDEALRERAAAVDPDAAAMIIYTSGTTALPKGAMHSHICVRAMEERSLAFGWTCNDVVLNYLPLFHLFGISLMLSSMIKGSRQVVMERFDADEAVDLIAQEKVTMAFGFDTHWLAMHDAHRVRPRDTASLRIGQCASGAEDTIASTYKIQELCLTTSGYGMTECWSWNALCFPNSTLEQRCESSGIAMPGVEFDIRDPDSGEAVGAGCEGEIWIRSYTNMLGYYGEPEATAAVFDGAWLRTGDKGRMRPDGFLQFLGRYKDMLKVGGENVSPAEVEALLATMDGVSQAAVVGVPDPKLNEVPVAFVVLRAGCETDQEAIVSACKGRIASFKIPRVVHFVAELPQTPTGKVQKAELRKQAIAMRSIADAV